MVAAAAATLALIGLAGPAQAAGNLPDPNATGSITITKLEQPAGARFTASKISGIDLDTNSGWLLEEQLAQGFSPDNVTRAHAYFADAGYPIDESNVFTSAITGKNGIAVFSDLPIGLYLVEETQAPPNTTPAVPFVISIPTTDPDQPNQWDYDMLVYPKDFIQPVHLSTSPAHPTTPVHTAATGTLSPAPTPIIDTGLGANAPDDGALPLILSGIVVVTAGAVGLLLAFGGRRRGIERRGTSSE